MELSIYKRNNPAYLTYEYVIHYIHEVLGEGNIVIPFSGRFISPQETVRAICDQIQMVQPIYYKDFFRALEGCVVFDNLGVSTRSQQLQRSQSRNDKEILISWYATQMLLNIPVIPEEIWKASRITKNAMDRQKKIIEMTKETIDERKEHERQYGTLPEKLLSFF